MSRPDRREKPASPRAFAAGLLLRIERENAYADRLLAGPGLRDYESRDRSFIRELVLGVLRWQLRLDRIIGMYYTKKPDLQPEVLIILRCGLYQIMFMDTVPDFAAVNESVTLARSIRGGAPSGLVNAILRRFLREGEPAMTADDPAERLAVEHAHPVWLVRRWLEAFGADETALMLAAGNGKHPVTLRANALKTDVAGLCGALETAGFHAEPFDAMPGYVTVEDAGGLFESAVFTGGLATAQDPAAGMAVRMLGASAGERILDLCSAPGGKTTHIAECTGDRAVIDAVDVSEPRLGLVTQAAERLGIDSIRCIAGDAASFTPPDGRLYDRVLCDVPCSGTGVFSKRPDMKWKRSETDIGRLAAIQRAILEQALTVVKPGGVVVYSTCTMEHEENSGIVAPVIDTKQAELLPDSRFEQYDTGCGCLVPPHRMGGTGAYAAKLRRNA